MNKFRFTIRILAIATFTFALASLAQAQATRTWVSGVGDDVNPCSRTAPCKTYAGAISKTAAGGEISTLDPGGFGSVTATKSITIDGTYGSGFGSILSSATTGVTINDGASATPGTAVVVIRRLSINGAGNPSGTNGVRFISGKKVSVESCDIFGFLGVGDGDGIEVALAADGKTMLVKDTNIFNCNRGIRATTTVGSFGLLIQNSRITGNSTGDGIRMDANAFASMAGSEVSLWSTGINMGGGAASGINIINSHVWANASTGLAAGASTSCRVGGSSFLGNGTGISQSAANNVKTFGDNYIPDPITGGGLQLIPPQ
jgi:hypothetical protein